MIFQEIVTVDGPSGAGKSTISRLLAKRLGATFLDTGAMYRAVAILAVDEDIDPDTLGYEPLLRKVLDSMVLSFVPPKGEMDDVGVVVNGRDRSREIRTPETSLLASRFSAIAMVREKMVCLQRQIGEKGGVVAEGRDMGTVVFPGARFKFFLDAVPETRAKRRVDQLVAQGQDAEYEAILQQIIQRDCDDRNRSLSPLTPAPDAVIIDSSDISIDQVVERMVTTITSSTRGETVQQ